MVDCPTCGDEFDSERAMMSHHQHHDEPYYDMVVRDEFDQSPEEFLREYYHDQMKTLDETADILGGSVQAIQRMAERHDVEFRSRSEAKQHEWDNLSEEEERKRVKAAHEKTRKLVENGEHNLAEYWDDLTEEERKELTKDAREVAFEKYGEEGPIGYWTKENPEKHAEVAQKAAPLGAPAREENGMKGMTGQDHPSWRGGRHLVDALRKQLRPSWWTVRDDAREEECYSCSTSEGKLDVHHIVPISAGGTNEEWNLMTLCESCHRKAEWYVRQFPEFDPVLTE